MQYVRFLRIRPSRKYGAEHGCVVLRDLLIVRNDVRLSSLPLHIPFRDILVSIDLDENFIGDPEFKRINQKIGKQCLRWL